MTEAEIAEMTAKYTLWGIIIGSVITGVIGAALLAWLTRRFNRSHANEQVNRDLRLHQATLTHTDRAAAYGELDAWISTVTKRADDICFSRVVAGLPQHQRNDYDVCVAMYQGPLRPPGRGRYLWSPLVAQRVRELQNQAVAMAQLVIVEGLGPDGWSHDGVSAALHPVSTPRNGHRHWRRGQRPHHGVHHTGR